MRLLLMMMALQVVTGANAQRNGGIFHPVENQDNYNSGLRNVIDTIFPVSFIPVDQGGLGCFTGYYTAPDTVCWAQK